MNQLATRDNGAIMEQVIIKGDLNNLSPQERADYYAAVCHSVGLNPLTRPFEYIRLSGKLTLYARKDATDQLRKIYGVSIKIVSQETVEGVYVVTAQATDASQRTDTDVGAVPTQGLKGDALANALMKAVTKAKRRVTLSICGLGLLDETEIEAIPSAEPFVEDAPAVEVEEPAPEPARERPRLMLDTGQQKTLHQYGRSYYGDQWDTKRPELVSAVTKGRATSSNDLYSDEAEYLITKLGEYIKARNAEQRKQLAQQAAPVEA